MVLPDGPLQLDVVGVARGFSRRCSPRPVLLRAVGDLSTGEGVRAALCWFGGRSCTLHHISKKKC